MGGGKQKYNKIEPIIETLNVFLNVYIDLFLVLNIILKWQKTLLYNYYRRFLFLLTDR